MAFLIDTNVLSELARPQPNPGVLQWAARVGPVALSAVTVEEIYFGLRWRPNPRVEEWIGSFLREGVTVLPVTEEVARVAGGLRAASQSRGHPRTQADMLIAATALCHDLTVVTRNVADFTDCGVAILNPFD